MSTVAFDGRYIAADTMGISGEYRLPNHADKLVVRNGRAFGICGRLAYLGAMVEWINVHGAEPRLYPPRGDWGALMVVAPDEPARIYSGDIPYAQGCPVPEATGSGCEFAIGAMLAGLSAPEAVAIAIQANYQSGGVVRFVDLHRSPLEVQEFDPAPWLAIPGRRPMPDLLNEPRLANARGELARVVERPNPPAGIWGMDCSHPPGMRRDEFGMGCGICKPCADRFAELTRIATSDELEYENLPMSEHSAIRRRVVAIIITPRFRAAVKGRSEGAVNQPWPEGAARAALRPLIAD